MTRAALLAGTLCIPGVLPYARAHPSGTLTLAYPSHRLGSHMWVFRDAGKPERKCLEQNACCGCLCAHTSLCKIRTARPIGVRCSLNTRSLKVCCLSINKVGISVSSAVYKLDLSLQFLVPCLYAPVRGIQ